MATVYQTLTPGSADFLTSAFPQLVRSGASFPVTGLAYDASIVEAAFWPIRAVNYGSGNLTVDIEWYAAMATSGDVVWAAQVAAMTPDADAQDIETKTLATANTVTDTHLGTVGKRPHRAVVTVTNLDALASQDDVWLRIARNATGNTMAGDAVLVMATVSYSDV